MAEAPATDWGEDRNVSLIRQIEELHAASEEQEQQLLVAAEIGQALLEEKEEVAAELAEVQSENAQLARQVEAMRQVRRGGGRRAVAPS